ncbi:MAG: sucrase ferredoxin [Nocardioides sp.]
MNFRCSVAGLERGDPLAGTASTVRSFLLVENPGPWGIDALHDSRLPPEVKDGLREAAARARVRPLLIRRYHRRAPREGFRVYAAHVGRDLGWLQTAVLDDAQELLDLDVAALGAGRSPGLVPAEGPVFFVCTHGKHDACCAEKGRPVAAALSAAYPDQTWEVSHIGGDRYAGNALVLPDGLYLGRLDADSAVAAADDLLGGRLPLDVLRGRSNLPMAAQAGEIALFRHLGETAMAAIHVLGHHRRDDLTTVDLARSEEHWRVVVRTTLGPGALLTCHARRENPTPRHEVVGIEHVGVS